MVKGIINQWLRVLSNESKIKTVRVIYFNASVQMITIKEAKALVGALCLSLLHQRKREVRGNGRSRRPWILYEANHKNSALTNG